MESLYQKPLGLETTVLMRKMDCIRGRQELSSGGMRKILMMGAFGIVFLGMVKARSGDASAPRHADLQEELNIIVSEVLAQFADKKLESNQLAVTVIDLTEPSKARSASYRGDVPIYPASVVKLFYLAAAHEWMEKGKLNDSEELRRAMKDMIVQSYNEATHYVLDATTETTGGPELPADDMKEWIEKRNAVNRHFLSIGYTNINVNQKPWCEGPYGRERIFVGKNFENRNALTTDATARLLAEIAEHRCVSKERSEQMLELLKRDPSRKASKDDQATDFIARALKPGAKLWSKAGWTSTARHDAAFVELPDGTRAVIVIFTTGHANEGEILPALAGKVLGALAKQPSGG